MSFTGCRVRLFCPPFGFQMRQHLDTENHHKPHDVHNAIKAMSWATRYYKCGALIIHFSLPLAIEIPDTCTTTFRCKECLNTLLLIRKLAKCDRAAHARNRFVLCKWKGRKLKKIPALQVQSKQPGKESERESKEKRERAKEKKRCWRWWAHCVRARSVRNFVLLQDISFSCAFRFCFRLHFPNPLWSRYVLVRGNSLALYLRLTSSATTHTLCAPHLGFVASFTYHCS